MNDALEHAIKRIRNIMIDEQIIQFAEMLAIAQGDAVNMQTEQWVRLHINDKGFVRHFTREVNVTAAKPKMYKAE